MKFVFQCLFKETPPTFHGWFTVNNEIHQHGTTSNVEIIRENYFDVGTVVQARFLHTKQSNLINYGGKSLQVAGPILWNGLPNEIRNKERINPFKYSCKKFYLDPRADINRASNNSSRNSSNINRRHGHRSQLDNNAFLNRAFVSRWDQ